MHEEQKFSSSSKLAKYWRCSVLSSGLKNNEGWCWKQFLAALVLKACLHLGRYFSQHTSLTATSWWR
jgi:hypothetical protein